MKTQLECIPCFVRQTLECADIVTADAAVREKIVCTMLKMLSEIDFLQSPPQMAQQVHRMIRTVSGQLDPYAPHKKRFNDFALGLYPELKKRVESAADPLAMAVKLAIAGNIIDFGIHGDLDEHAVSHTIASALTTELDAHVLADFRTAVAKAKNILYLGDNTGEIVFDKLLIEQLPREKVTFVVKGSAILNDATMQDAVDVGLTSLVKVIDNGADAPGAVLEICSPKFMSYYNATDLVISKGQGNYETLSEEPKNIFFMLKAKCAVVARHLGCPLGTCIFMKHCDKDFATSNKLVS